MTTRKNPWSWSPSVLHPLQPQRTLFHGLWKPFLCTAWHTALLLRREDGVMWSESEHVQQQCLLYKYVNNKCVKKMQSTKAAVAQFLEWVENNDWNVGGSIPAPIPFLRCPWPRHGTLIAPNGTSCTLHGCSHPLVYEFVSERWMGLREYLENDYITGK